MVTGLCSHLDVDWQEYISNIIQVIGRIHPLAVMGDFLAGYRLPRGACMAPCHIILSQPLSQYGSKGLSHSRLQILILK